MMISIGFLTGALALLCLIGLVVTAIKHKLSKKGEGKSSDLKGVFFVIGFVPMLFVTLSSFRGHSAYLSQFFAYIRNPFLSMEFFFDALIGFDELPFVMDFFTAILFGSTVAITLSGDFEPRCVPDHLSGRAGNKDAFSDFNGSESREGSASYLTFGRYLS